MIINYLLIISFYLVSLSAFAQKEGLVSKIENPDVYFTGDRKTWVGKTIYFLKEPNSQTLNPYFDWYYDPFNMRETKPNPEDLMYTKGLIEEVWIGNLHVDKPRKNYWKQGFFWKVRLKKNNKFIYFWDDVEFGVSNFGFVKDYEEARNHIGESLWNKSRDILYKMDDSAVISLKNLEKVLIADVQWGEFGNFPLKLIIETQSGESGYLVEKKYAEFIKDWHISNPKEKYTGWQYNDWKLIEKRRLRPGMSMEMVKVSWGEPTKTEIKYDTKAVGYELWTYEGVKESTYFIRFQDKKLKHVWWGEKKKK
jgi:hypothetical protein